MIGPVTRRAALRLSGGLSLGGALASIGVVRPKVPPALVPETGEIAVPSILHLTPSQSLARKILELEDNKGTRRFQGFDPSIECLRSVSPAMKARIQPVRDEANFTWVQKMRKSAGYL